MMNLLGGSTVRSLSLGFLTACSILSFGASAEEEVGVWKKDDVGRGGLFNMAPGVDEENLTTSYYKWVRDTYGNYRLLPLPFSVEPPSDTEDIIRIQFKSNYGEGVNQLDFYFMEKYQMGDGAGSKNNVWSEDIWTNPGYVPRRGITGGTPEAGNKLGEAFHVFSDTAFTGKDNGFLDKNQKIYVNQSSVMVDKTADPLSDKIVADSGSISGVFVQNNIGSVDYVKNVTALSRKSKGGEYYTERPGDDVVIQGGEIADNLAADKAWGGLIVFNEKVTTATTNVSASDVSKIPSVTGDFIGNFNNKTYVRFRGGLIYNGFLGYIGEISGNFIGNNFGVFDTVYASGKGSDTLKTSHGGVIYNHSNGTIGSITGNFISNGIWLDITTSDNLQHATKNRVDVIGGVLVNHGLIEKGINITAIGNYAYAATVANSGVMRNYSGKGYVGIIGADDEGVSIGGLYIGNYARAVTGDAYGGIMRNNGEIQGRIQGTYIGNYASADGNYTVSHYSYTVDKVGYGEGHYMYDPDIAGNGIDIEDNPYISYEEAKEKARQDGTLEEFAKEENKAKFYLVRSSMRRLHTGDRTGQAQGGVFYNTIKDDGTAGTNATIHDIEATFESNYVVSKWGEASGGVLYNQDATVDNIDGSFTGNYAVSLAHMARGGAIYNKLMLKDQAVIGDIGTEYDAKTGISRAVEFNSNYAQGRIAGGGAIYASTHSEIGEIYANFRYNYALSELGFKKYKDDAETEFSDDYKEFMSPEAGFNPDHLSNPEIEDSPDYYEYRARGGALFVDNFAEVDEIHVDLFVGNYAKGMEMGAKVRGGAILVTTGGKIGHISGYKKEELALFSNNYALSVQGNELNTFGGAIRFDNSVINTLSANFQNNWTTGSGGALSLTESGFIFEVTGNFVGNQAGHLGGAVHNLGTIGYLGSIFVYETDENGATQIVKKDVLTDVDDYDNAVRDSDGRIMTESDGTRKRNLAGYYEYDGSVRGGFINTSFVGNKVDNNSIRTVDKDGHWVLWDEANGAWTGTDGQQAWETRVGSVRGLGGAIYTTDNLFITANDPTTPLKIMNNQVWYQDKEGTDKVKEGDDGIKRLNTALYVDSSRWSKEDPIAIYLIATENSQMTITDAIRGAEDSGYGFVLRLRGHSDKYEYQTSEYEGGGTIYISGPVAQSYAIMDDVTLQIGQCINHFSFGSGDTQWREYMPSYIPDSEEYGRSDVFRRSHLSVRSGTVDLTADDGELTEFIFDSLISYGNTWRYASKGTNDRDISDFYKKHDLYAKWNVDVQGSGDATKRGETGRADLITVISDVDEKGNFIVGTNKSEGRITLSAVNVKYTDGMYEYDPDGSVDYPLHNEFTFKAQILNIVLRDENGTILTEDKYADTKYLTSDSPLQLDNALNPVDWEHSVMSSDEVLAKDIRLATTRTYHDSIEIVGWRDNLAAWAEMTDDAADSRYDEPGCYWDEGTFDARKKVFTLVSGHHDLTRDVCDLTEPVDKDKWQPTNGAVWGNDWTIRGLNQSNVLDLNEKNLLTIVEDYQQARLENFTLNKVKNRSILNNGKLTLDTMKADEITVNNRDTLTLQGYMTIDKSITITTKDEDVALLAATGAPQWKQMFINDKTEVEGLKALDSQNTVINITEGTVEKQDITHQGSAVKYAEALEKDSETALTPEILADANFTTVTNLYTTQDGKVTEGFRNFQQNSLTMEGGKLNLGVMGSEVLWLRGLHMRGGLIHVSSSTVDLANETMGGLRGETDGKDKASYTGGVIWLDNIRIVSDGGMVTHVKFVTSDAGDAVKDNNIRDTYMWGPKYQYLVTYNDQERLNDRGEHSHNGYYTFSRTDRVNPTIFVEPVAELTGGFTQMTTIYDYAFEHADLFSSTMENTRQPLEDAPVVARVKGYKEAPAAAPSCPTNLAGLRSGMWVRPYASFEKMDLNNGPRVNSSIYGALVGGDSGLMELRDGWAAVTSVYGSYTGARQTYEGNRTNQNGMGVGLTETFYKGRFYTAVTASVGISDVRTNTAYGTEDYSMLMAGVASRTGYSMNLGSCRYVLQPTLLMSYTFVNASDYTNAAGVHMDSDPLQVFQLHPYVKGIMHSMSGWDPYVTVGYVHNFMGKTSYRADGDKLPQLSIDPYVECGVGIQKTWNEKYTFYGQATGRQGGRKGAEVSAGIRWVW